jgi:hypothetical protein
MMNFRDIKIKSKISDLMRIGGPWDGGYVVSKTAVEAATRLYTYGIGYDSSFEKHFAGLYPDKKIYMYDNTYNDPDLASMELSKITSDYGNIFYNAQEGLWPTSITKKNIYPNTFFKHIAENKDENENIYLKMDIEGHELSFFQSIQDYTSELKNVVGLSVEFHYVRLDNIDMLSCIVGIWENLLKNYDIVHISGNNNFGLEVINDIEFPFLPEISFIRKDLNTAKVEGPRTYPLEGLDFKNVPENPDLHFTIGKPIKSK